MWILLLHFAAVVLGLVLAAWVLKRRRNRKRLVAAALAVILDHRERARLYPGFYTQPHLLKVMNDLDVAVALNEHNYRVREATAIYNLSEALQHVN